MLCLSNVSRVVAKNHIAQLVKKFSLYGATNQIAKRSMSTKASLDIGGIYPPIATPFDKDENVDYGRLEHNMDLWSKADLAGKTASLFSETCIFDTCCLVLDPINHILVAGSSPLNE